MRPRLERALDQALEYLRVRQRPSGEFTTYVSPDEEMRADCTFDSSPFGTTLAIYSLAFVPDTRALAMINKALDFLAREMEGPGLWRYWTREHPRHAFIPPDLDDTSCASFALRRHGRVPPGNRGLILANRDPGGRFYTWLTPRWRMPRDRRYWRLVLPQLVFFPRLVAFWRSSEAAPNDVDCVVNANVLLYLGESAETDPAIDYLIDTVRRHREGECDKWHRRPLSVYYMLSRAYFNGARRLGVVRDLVIERIRALGRRAGGFGNELESALGACALLNVDAAPSELDRSVEYLLDTQDRSGAWPKTPLYWGGPKKMYGWGSEELTTALCVEALARYRGAIDHS